MYGRASINFYAFNSNGNKGIACGLNNLQKIRDGEPLGGKSRAEDDFAMSRAQNSTLPLSSNVRTSPNSLFLKIVIPTIRRYGMYAKDELLNNPDLMIAALTELKAEREKAKQLGRSASSKYELLCESYRHYRDSCAFWCLCSQAPHTADKAAKY